MTGRTPRVALFVGCIVDRYLPDLGFAAVTLLEDAGCEVIVPPQTCCGRLFAADAQCLGGMADETDYVVTLSAACTAHLKQCAGQEDDVLLAAADKVYEIHHFLVEIAKVSAVTAACEARALYTAAAGSATAEHAHDCARRLLASVARLEMLDPPEACCLSPGAAEFDPAALGADLVVTPEPQTVLELAHALAQRTPLMRVRHSLQLLTGDSPERHGRV